MPTLTTRQTLRGLDIGLLTVTVILLVVGIAALLSFSLNTGAVGQDLVIRQSIFALLGLTAVWFLAKTDYRFFAGLHWVLYGFSIALLVAVMFFGRTINGTTGWFNLGFAQLQPVEFVKVAMAVVLAKFFSDHQDELQELSFVGRSALVAAVPVLLVMAQPDFGSAFVLIAMWLGILIVVPVPKKYLLMIFSAFAVLSVVAWFGLLKPYQKDRILTFVHPASNSRGAGYNVKQSVTAIGSGGWFGRGLGLGPQSQLNFIPERQTDFIFATIGEELGFVGGGAVILLFGLLFWRLMLMFRRSQDMFSGLLVVSLAVVLFVHVIINIGMNIGVFPVTGIPLPFISYGGSALLANLLAVGLLESVAVRQRARTE